MIFIKFFSDLFKQDKSRYIKLHRRKDIYYECDIQCHELEGRGHKILEVVQHNGEIIIIFRKLFDSPESEEYAVYIRGRIINSKGIKVPDLRLDAVYYKGSATITVGDIQIFGANQNRGYGTLILKELFKIASNQKVRRIEGQIYEVDWDHIDRLKHFYEKNGCVVNLDTEKKSGIVYWERH